MKDKYPQLKNWDSYKARAFHTYTYDEIIHKLDLITRALADNAPTVRDRLAEKAIFDGQGHCFILH